MMTGNAPVSGDAVENGLCHCGGVKSELKAPDEKTPSDIVFLLVFTVSRVALAYPP